MTPPPDAPWRVTYYDGSSNGFRFHQETIGADVRFTYTPVTPAFSSSGVYDGGAPADGILDDAQVADLWAWVHKLVAETTLHLTTRPMGSGTLRVNAADAAHTVILKDSPLLDAFHTFLRPFRAP